MVENDEAAFRILEIAAILFPLLLIVVQIFSSHLLSNEDSPLSRASNYVQFFVYAAFLLTIAVVAASFELLFQPYSFRIRIALMALYVAFILIGITTGHIGREVRRVMDEQAWQVDLSTSVPEDQTTSDKDENQPNDD